MNQISGKSTINQPVSIEEKPKFGVSNSDQTKLALRLLAKTKSQNEEETATKGEGQYLFSLVLEF